MTTENRQEHEKFARELFADRRNPVDTATVKEELDQIWHSLQEDADLRSEAEGGGVKVAAITRAVASPFEVPQREAYDWATLVVIAATGRIVGELGLRGFDWLFDNIVAPRLAARIGLRRRPPGTN